jgi:segregation and condensation protein A
LSEANIISLGEIDGAGFKVVLEDYSGPIDLLLHLVKSNELEIEKLSLAHVASQYLECLDQMQKLDLEIAGEYLVIAATLLSIKSSVLLNEPVELVIDDDGNMIDPHEELLRKLREAAIYRDGAKQLESMDCLGLEVFAPPSQLKKFKPDSDVYADHNPMLLGRGLSSRFISVRESWLKICN